MTEPLLGALKSPPDSRDYRAADRDRYAELVAQIADGEVELPEAYSLAPLPVRLEQEGGTCVAASTGGLWSWHQAQQLGRFPTPDYLRLYRRCKELDGIPDQEGTYPRVALSIARNEGVRELKGAGMLGHSWLLGDYFNLLLERDPVLAVKTALVAFRRPVALAFDFYNSMFGAQDPDGRWPGGVLPEPDYGQIGGHEVWVYAYRTAPADWTGKGAQPGTLSRLVKGETVLRCVNSWGPDANNGHGIFDFPAHLWRLVHDCWATTDR